MQKNIISFYQHIKSVAISVCPNEMGDDYLPDSSLLIGWLENYDRWFKDAVGINEGEHVYALYNRQITLFGSGLLKLPAILKKLAETIIPLGFALSITVDILELYDDFMTVESLCNENLLSSIGIYTDNIDKLSEFTDIESFITRITKLKRQIGLIGQVSRFSEYGLLCSKSLNSTDITLYPLTYENDSEGECIYPYIEKSCANHLQLYICKDGNIYPCLGLLGIQDYAISNISNGIEEFNIMGDKANVDLLKLYQQGPEIQTDNSLCRKYTSLPWICERHRMELLKDA